MRQARGSDRATGDATGSAHCLLALFGVMDPSPEQSAGAQLLAHALRDLQMLRAGSVETK